MTLTPKDGVGNSSEKIYVQIENRTTSGKDDKIPISEGIVTEICMNTMRDGHKVTCPYWFPQGFSDLPSEYKDLETVNTDYKKDTFIKMLEDKGFTLYEGNPYWTNEDLNHRYWEDGSGYTFQVTGDNNPFGKKPVYQYWVDFNRDTDKLSRVLLSLEKFVD